MQGVSAGNPINDRARLENPAVCDSGESSARVLFKAVSDAC